MVVALGKGKAVKMLLLLTVAFEWVIPPARNPLFPHLTSSMDGEGHACKDNNLGCAEWAADGECEHNPGYMLSPNGCMDACTKCADGSSDEMRSPKVR